MRTAGPWAPQQGASSFGAAELAPFHTVKYVFFGIRFASSGHYPSQTYLLKFVSQLYDRYRNGKGPTFYRDALVIYGSSAVSACMYPYVFLTLRRSSEYETESGWAGGRAILCFFVRWELGRKLGRSVGRRPTDRPSSRASYRQAAAVKMAAAQGGAQERRMHVERIRMKSKCAVKRF